MLDQLGQNLLDEINMGTPLGWALMVVISVVATGIVKMLLKFVEARVKSLGHRFKGISDNIIVAVIASTRSWTLFIWCLNVLVQSSASAQPAKNAIFVLFVISAAVQVAIWGLKGIAIWRDEYLKVKIGKDPSAASAIGLVGTALQGLFIIALILMSLSNLGVDIAALIAGLGVGGIAVALAAQNILGDLFASLSIVLDKPFVTGDFIVAGNDSGTVEYIGIKTTRLRSLSGEQLIFANKDLLESRVKNFKRMYERRVVMNFDVSYFTPLEKLKEIPHWISKFINDDSLLRLDRCHLASFTESALRYELVYWVTKPEFNAYMDHNQEVMYKILQRFEENGIQFAMGARALMVQNSDADPESRPPERTAPRENEMASGKSASH